MADALQRENEQLEARIRSERQSKRDTSLTQVPPCFLTLSLSLFPSLSLSLPISLLSFSLF
jgi:hypothetical protein